MKKDELRKKSIKQFIWNIREAIRFVEMGSGSKHKGVFDILKPIIEIHIAQLEEFENKNGKSVFNPSQTQK